MAGFETIFARLFFLQNLIVLQNLILKKVFPSF